MSYNFAGKCALVTGAGQGIGRAICVALHKSGANVIALSRTQSHLDSLKQEFPDIKTISVDLCDWNATRAVVESCDLVHLLVNNAGMNIPESFVDVTPEAIDKILNTNFKSMINVSQVVAKKLIETKIEGGSIVNISSIASSLAFNAHTIYTASKAAVDGATKVMAMELGKSKIRVNTVNPTVIMTDLAKQYWTQEKLDPLLQRIPIERVGNLDDVVNAVLFLLSDQSSFINGVSIPIEGGLSVVGTIIPKEN